MLLLADPFLTLLFLTLALLLRESLALLLKLTRLALLLKLPNAGFCFVELRGGVPNLLLRLIEQMGEFGPVEKIALVHFVA